MASFRGTHTAEDNMSKLLFADSESYGEYKDAK
jgi:hypothetical protein